MRGVANELSRRIRERYGSVAHFAARHNISIYVMRDLAKGKINGRKSGDTKVKRAINLLRREDIWVKAAK